MPSLNKALSKGHAAVIAYAGAITRLFLIDKNLLKMGFICFVVSFDFSTYLFLSPVFKEVFFNIGHKNAMVGMQFTGIFALGFAGRPLGGYLIGRYGDAYGRKPALMSIQILFFISLLITVLLPSYIHLGFMASFLLIIVRLLQGAGFGAQLVLSWVYIAETLPRKNIVLSISMVLACAVFGSAMSALLTTTLKYLPSSILITYGWRLLLICCALFTFFSFNVCRTLPETCLYRHYAATGRQTPKQDRNNSRLNRLTALLLTMALSTIISSVVILIVVMLPNLIALRFSVEPSLLDYANVVGMMFMAIGMVGYGWIGSRIGVGRAVTGGAVVLAITAFGFFYYLSHSHGSYIIALYAWLGFCGGVVSLCVERIMHLFDISRRCTSISMVYNTVAIFTSTVLPYSLLYFTRTVSFAPALYIIFICICLFMLGRLTCHPINKSALEALQT